MYMYIAYLSIYLSIFHLFINLEPPILVPYTLRDVLLHVQRLQELLGSNPLQQSITCTNGLSLSMLSAVIMADLESELNYDIHHHSYDVFYQLKLYKKCIVMVTDMEHTLYVCNHDIFIELI